MVNIKRKKRNPIITTIKQAKRVITVVVGFTVVLLGTVMLALPGPGIFTILLGLALLGTEFVWARRLMKRVGHGANHIKNSIFNNNKRESVTDDQ